MKTISEHMDERRDERRKDIEGEIAMVLLLAMLIAFGGWLAVKGIANAAATVHQFEQLREQGH